MSIVYKILAPVLRAAGFLGLLLGLYYGIVMIAASGIKDGWPWCLLAAASLAAILAGDWMKKKTGAPQ